MTPQLDHRIISSFVLWFDNKLLEKGQAYTNYTGVLYPDKYNKVSGKKVYSSSYRQWVADSSIVGASIPSGVYSGETFIPRGASGLVIDFDRGRVLIDTTGTLTSASGIFAVKDFNVYYSNEEAESILFETSYHQSKTWQTPTGYVEALKTVPAVFIKYYPEENKPFAFGGTDETMSRFKAVVITNNEFNFEGICSIFRDTARTNFGLLENSELPYTPYGDLKTSPYNYTGIAYPKTDPNLMFINDVFVNKLGQSVSEDLEGYQCAIITFDVPIVRNPRS